jgi:hypothetical protein
MSIIAPYTAPEFDKSALITIDVRTRLDSGALLAGAVQEIGAPSMSKVHASWKESGSRC